MHTEYLALLGHKGTDKVTGFTGVVVSVSGDLFGCVQCYLVPNVGADGKIGEGYWFDTKRISIEGDPVMLQPTFDHIPGGAKLPAPIKA